MNEKTTKQRILDTMCTLVAQRGYDKTSIGQIADLIGIKKASIYSRLFYLDKSLRVRFFAVAFCFTKELPKASISFAKKKSLFEKNDWILYLW